MPSTESPTPLAGRRIAVTGAAGFIGNTICRRLAEDGALVRGIDIAAAGAERVRAAGAEFAAADVTSATALREALDGAEIVIHAAAFVRDWGTMAEFVEVNVRGTAMVLDAAEAVNAERVVHISSVVVYGYDDPSEQDESAFLRSYGIPYIDTKSSSDRLARRRGAVVVRPGDVYGPGSIPWVLRPLELAKSGQMAVPSGERRMLPVYVDDLVDAALVGAVAGERGEAYTAWDDRRPVSFGEHFDRIAQMAGARPARRLPRPLLELLGAAVEAGSRLSGGPPPFTARAVTFLDRRGTASTARMRGLGWEPRVPYERGMGLTEDWLRAEGLI
jgi:nucleoside-diphosphate-sugar epimerase